MSAQTPFIFVAATRYAIRRFLTSASEVVAGEVLDHAETIRRDHGATAAILNEIEELLAESAPTLIGTREEWEANRRRWQAVAQALRSERVGTAASGGERG